MLILADPPRLIDPPSVKPFPAVTVRLEFAKSVFDTVPSVISPDSMDVPSDEEIEIEPPSATRPPPESPVPAVTVTLEFVRSPFAMDPS